MPTYTEIMHWVANYILPASLVLNLMIILFRMFIRPIFAKNITVTNKKTGKSVTVPIKYEKTSSRRISEVLQDVA